MTGTIINIITIIIGSLLGIHFGSKLPERIRNTVISVLGLFTLALGMQMFLKTSNSLIVLIALLIGAILGEWWRIEERLENLGKKMEGSFARSLKNQDLSRFVEGFLAASILFCVGPMAILGSIQDGMSGDFSLLTAKAIMDGFAAMAFAASMGIGVAFSSIPILLFQGGLSLLAVQAQPFITTSIINEMSATGGVILMGIAISNILAICKIRTANFLPALFLAPLLAALIARIAGG